MIWPAAEHRPSNCVAVSWPISSIVAMSFCSNGDGGAIGGSSSSGIGGVRCGMASGCSSKRTADLK